ncbi:MAG: FAD-binding protein [Proteobacteria bacterium]|nr:FAD-binding protein [Pseudomonadota bacterium]MBU1738839.1 FAD-binding protein [Pseudomonadota bacterium]
MNSKTLKELAAIVGSDNLTTTHEDLLCYAYDGSGREFLPEAVVFPGSTDEVSRIMALASARNFPVVPRGAGTGMTGGSLAVNGGLVMAMSRLNRIIEIDTANQVAVVEPGVITGRFQQEVGRAGLFYPPDPASHDFCTIGGNVGECAGGPRAVKYGVTRDYVLGLEAVLPDGRIINTGVRTAKGVAGYDLTRLLVGSEGTLAVITRIILKLLPAPASRKTFLLLFDNLSAATSLVARILGRITPCTLEYMDRTALQVVADSLPAPLPGNTEALLLVELDGDLDLVKLQAENLRNFLTGQPGLLESRLAETAAESAALWAARRAISPSTFKLKPHKIGEDIVVPRTLIPDLVEYTEILAADLDLTILTFGHAGDGNIHVNIMLDRNDPKQKAAGKTAKEKLFSRVIEMGGTITGEHGIGITKSSFLDREIDRNTLAMMRAIKKTFDPGNILNPGKIFPPSE